MIPPSLKTALPPTAEPGYLAAMGNDFVPPPEVLQAYFDAPCRCAPIDAGHINETYRVQIGSERFVLQKLSAIFSPQINEDIAALVPHVHKAGLPCPTLLPNRQGRLWFVAADGACWRLLTHLPGETFLYATDARTAYAAGHFLARFHRALRPVRHRFVAARLGVHDTDAHIAGLQAALLTHREHPAYPAVAKRTPEVVARLAGLQPWPQRPAAIVHGDAKLSNFLFAAPDKAHALVDLDTLGEMALHLELGDALRSWTNKGADGHSPSALSQGHFEAALEGYAAGVPGGLDAQDAALLAASTLRIALELTGRFLRDALEERYFSWDRRKYDHAWQHHLSRADAQMAYARSLGDALSWAHACACRLGH